MSFMSFFLGVVSDVDLTWPQALLNLWPLSALASSFVLCAENPQGDPTNCIL